MQLERTLPPAFRRSAMPIALVLLVLNIALIVHAAKTGRFMPWGYVILMIPGFGGLAYILVELLPEWFRGSEGQKVRARVSGTLDPEKRYRELSDQMQF